MLLVNGTYQTSNHPVVLTPAGDVRGRVLPDGGLLFAGIPFAAPPVDKDRFAPPRPVTPWTGARDATTFPPPPLQTALPGAQEDCLYVNVWTPSSVGCRPVVVWIYGGAFEMGSASPPMTDAASFSRRADVVVVAANYRVGALGFLCAPGVANLGLQDQMAALHWVRQAIGAFGGDAANVTVMGESAGAFCIGALLGVAAARGLFDQAILQSGSTSRIFPLATASAIAEDLFVLLGVTDVGQLRVVPGRRILDTQGAVIDRDLGQRNLPGGRSWGVVLDGEVLAEDPQFVVERGGAAHVPLLVTTTMEEARLFEVLQGDGYAPTDEGALVDEMERASVPDPEALLAAYREVQPGASLARLRSAFLTDAIYRWPAERLASAQIAAGGSAFVGLFAAEPFGVDLGACHGSDLPYVFDALGQGGLFPVPDTPTHQEIRDEVIDAWARFAATGDPGWDLWEPSRAESRRCFP